MRRLLPLALLLVLWVPAARAWTWPVGGPIVQGFAFDPAHPYAGGQHRGVDIGASSGAPVKAPAAGVVTFAGSVPTNGLTVTIETADSLAVTLTHLGSVEVARGASVAEGAVVGAVGPSGTAEVEGPYVHLGIRLSSDSNGYLDPLSLLPAAAPAAEPASEPAQEPAAGAPGSGDQAVAPGDASPSTGSSAIEAAPPTVAAPAAPPASSDTAPPVAPAVAEPSAAPATTAQGSGDPTAAPAEPSASTGPPPIVASGASPAPGDAASPVEAPPTEEPTGDAEAAFADSPPPTVAHGASPAPGDAASSAEASPAQAPTGEAGSEPADVAPAVTPDTGAGPAPSLGASPKVSPAETEPPVAEQSTGHARAATSGAASAVADHALDSAHAARRNVPTSTLRPKAAPATTAPVSHTARSSTSHRRIPVHDRLATTLHRPVRAPHAAVEPASAEAPVSTAGRAPVAAQTSPLFRGRGAPRAASAAIEPQSGDRAGSPVSAWEIAVSLLVLVVGGVGAVRLGRRRRSSPKLPDGTAVVVELPTRDDAAGAAERDRLAA